MNVFSNDRSSIATFDLNIFPELVEIGKVTRCRSVLKDRHCPHSNGSDWTAKSAVDQKSKKTLIFFIIVFSFCSMTFIRKSDEESLFRCFSGILCFRVLTSKLSVGRSVGECSLEWGHYQTEWKKKRWSMWCLLFLDRVHVAMMWERRAIYSVLRCWRQQQRQQGSAAPGLNTSHRL